MPPSPTTPRNSRFVTALFLIVFALAIGLMLRLLAVYLSAIVIALVLVSLFYPLFKRACALLKGRRRLAAGLTSAAVVVGVLVPVTLVLVSLSHEIVSAYARSGSHEQPFVTQLLDLLQSEHPLIAQLRALGAQAGLDLGPESLRAHATQAGASIATYLYELLRGIASNAFRTVLQFGLMVVVMFAVFVDGPKLKVYLLDLSPLPDTQEEMLARRFAEISRAVFLGNGAASLLQGLFGGLGFYLFGIGSGLLWGTAIAFLAFLPIVGASVVFLPAALFLFATGKIGLGIGFALYNALYVGVLEYGLKPRLIGDRSKMSGALVFVGILAGLQLFGILGLFYGPLILTMFLTVADIYQSEYRDDLMAVRSPWARADNERSEP